LGDRKKIISRIQESEVQESEVKTTKQSPNSVGAPVKFSMEQVLQLFAIACSKPDDYGRPISHWTARELADEIMKLLIIESISIRHVGRLLEEAELKPYGRADNLCSPTIA
jgi:putative transposase